MKTRNVLLAHPRGVFTDSHGGLWTPTTTAHPRAVAFGPTGVALRIEVTLSDLDTPRLEKDAGEWEWLKA